MKKILWYIFIQFKYGRIFNIKKNLFLYVHKYKLKKCGKDVSMHPNVEIRSHENIEIGDNVSINHNTELYGGGGISIGNGTMLSYYVTILSDSRSFRGECPLKSPKRTLDRIQKKVTLGDDVWVGTKAIILPGISIGDHAIVAAGAVVTKNVAEWSIVAGNPARVVGSRLNMKENDA